MQYRHFSVCTDNNPLTYILKTPNLDTIGHRWVSALAGYDMTIKYLKGSDNKVADALSWINTRLDLDTVTELLNHAKGGVPWAETKDIRIIKEEEQADQEVILQVTQLAKQERRFRNLHMEDWLQAQWMDPMIHQNARHQGCDRTLSLMKEHFWWLGMANTLFLVVWNCGRCRQFEAKGQLPGMEPILYTQPMELVHIDYIGMEATVATKEKLVVKNVLMVVDHFTR